MSREVIYGRSPQEIRDDAALSAAEALRSVTWDAQAERVLKAFVGGEPVVPCLDAVEKQLRRTADRCALDRYFRAAADLHEAATILYAIARRARFAGW